MCVVIRHYLAALFVLHLCLQFASSAKKPRIPCPEIFQYQRSGDIRSGLVTITSPLDTLVVSVELSQRESSSYNGHLSLDQDLQETRKKLENGEPISYRVDFPLPNVYPRVTAIKINDNTICSGPGYSPPNRNFRLQHSFFPSKKTPSNRGTTISRQPEIKHLPSFTTTQTKNKAEPITQQNGANNKPSSSNPFLENALKNRQHGTSVPTTAPRMSVAPKLSTDVECGLEALTPFVVNGYDFPRGKFPWLVAIYLRDGADLKFTCGGSLISRRTVITAAHCFPSSIYSPDLVSLNLGRHNLFISEEGSQQRDVSSVTIHPNYNISVISDADIALLHMKIPVSFNQYIRSICLWSQSSDLSLIENNEAFIAGWGADNHGNSVSIAKMVTAKIASEADCLRSSVLFRTLNSTRALCAGNRDGSGPCIGDSGGGLMLQVSGVWTLRGVLSVGKTIQNNCDLKEFVVYCDVAKHITWVRQNMLS